MDWLNLHHSVLDSEAVVGSEPVDRATWLFLLRYCIGQENGGVIVGAREWGDRRWQQLCRVTKAEVLRETDLWTWDNGDLRVHAYPVAKEAEVQAKRMGGQAGAKARWHSSANGSAIGSANGSAIEMPDAEGKGREGKGSGRGATAAIPFSQGKIDTVRLMADYGIPTAPKAVAEWRGGLNKLARCKSEAEARAFIAWAIEVCRSQNVIVEHWRQVRLLAIEWDSGMRNSVPWSA